jgi:hypothetical protein
VVHVSRDREGTRSVQEIAATEEGGLMRLWRMGESVVRMPARLRGRLG